MRSALGMNREERRKQMIDLLAWRKRDHLSYRALEEVTGISRNTLAAWSSRLRRESTSEQEVRDTPFVELVAADEPIEGDSPIEIVIGSHTLRVRRGFDEAILSRALAVVSSRC